MPSKPFKNLRTFCKMHTLYRDDPLSTEGHSLLPKSEKHVSFNPDLEHHNIEDIRTKQKKRVTRRLHVFGLLSLCFSLLFYAHAWRRPHYHRHNPTMTKSTPNHKSATFAFDNLEQFSLKEVLDNQGYILLDIHGTITLTSSPPSQDAAIVANVSMTTHNIEIESTNFDSTPTGLTVGNPGLKNRSYFRRPAITLDINVHVKPGGNLAVFEADTRHLHIEIDPSLDVTISNKTTLSTISGHINSPSAPSKFHSREKYLSSISGGIRGEYSLEDILSCTTSSGGIRIGVLPKEAGKEIAPAAFTAKSASGHSDVQFRTVGAPEREYEVDVRTGSGGVSGTYIHGVRTRIESGSGGMRVMVVPFGGEGASELVTEGASGSSDITVMAPLGAGKTLGALRSVHRSVSGSLRLSYPREWAGSFEGSSVSGSLSAEGPGLDVERGGGPGLKRVSGRSKVEGKAELSFSSVSGGARLVVG